MFFSVLVPAYNVEKYLRNCLESIRRQTFQDFEVIVVDDGSTDTTPAICDEYTATDERFRVIHKENGGVVSARKAGAARASGEYLVTVDGDDEIEDDLLFEMHRLITEKDPDLITLGFKVVRENGEFMFERLNDIREGYYAGDTLSDFTSKLFYDKRREGFNCGCVVFSTWSKVIRASIYKESIANVDDKVDKGDDLVAFLYMMKKVKAVVASDYSGYHYRLQPSSLMHVRRVEDLYKQAVLRDEIYRAVAGDREILDRASVCIFSLTYERLLELVGPDTSYRQFREIIQVIKKYHLFDCIKKMGALRQGFSISEKIKLLIIRIGCWRILYRHLMKNMEREAVGA
uniref:glycosyltransferase family 2 protein n=1 Tax=Eubacterium cellulosolvens TaxID=29322 RepID=UPI0006844157|nr:glycosyltransferase family 2 protein [[Eubacterium] cellulosolvens]